MYYLNQKIGCQYQFGAGNTLIKIFMKKSKILQTLSLRPQPADFSKLILKPRVNCANKKLPRHQLQQSIKASNQDCFEGTTHLWLHWNEIDNIIGLLIPFKFANLITINLGGNHLTTIETITQLSMPNLQELFIWNNHITSIKTISRSNLPSLTTLDLSGNPIVELQKIRQLNSRSMKRLVFQSSKVNDVTESLLLFNLKQMCILEIAHTQIVKFKGKCIITQPSNNRKKIAFELNIEPDKKNATIKYI